MLEILLILGVMVCIVWKLESQRFERARSTWGMAGTEPQRRAELAAPPKPRLAIEGTQRPLIRDKKFVRHFGVNPAAIHDLRVYARIGCFEQFPASVRSFITHLHAAGCAVGTEIMELMYHSRPLGEAEAVYFALVEAGDEPHVVTFLDRLRLG